MGKKISQITSEESTSISDTDWFEGEESGGTSFKTAFSVIKSTLKSYFDTLYLSGLAVSTASVTTSNVTGVEGTLHNLDVSGMTANRDFNLPTPSAAGKRIGVRLSVGNYTYELLLKINSVEWSRIFIDGEIVIFVSTGTGAGDWKIENDGRIPCKAKIKNTASQTINNGTVTTVILDEDGGYNTGSCADTGNNRMRFRRTGKYDCKGSLRYNSLSGMFAFRVVAFFEDGAGNVLAGNEKNANSGSYPFLIIARDLQRSAGEYLILTTYQNTGASQTTYVAIAALCPMLEITEILP